MIKGFLLHNLSEAVLSCLANGCVYLSIPLSLSLSLFLEILALLQFTSGLPKCKVFRSQPYAYLFIGIFLLLLKVQPSFLILATLRRVLSSLRRFRTRHRLEPNNKCSTAAISEPRACTKLREAEI
jgi:hypothetical protein